MVCIDLVLWYWVDRLHSLLYLYAQRRILTSTSFHPPPQSFICGFLFSLHFHLFHVVSLQMQSNSPFKFGVIATVNESSLSRFCSALPHAALAHSREIRLESLRDSIEEVARLVLETQTEQPTILTLRSKGEGGTELIGVDEQLAFWMKIPRKLRQLVNEPESPVFVDFGIDIIQHTIHPPPFPWRKIGVSRHFMDRTPPNALGQLRVLMDTPAGAFIKFVTMATSEEDIPRIRSLYDCQRVPRPFMAFLMGKLGERSRTDCPLWGSAGTYGYIDGFTSAAPGQLPVSTLMSHPNIIQAYGN